MPVTTLLTRPSATAATGLLAGFAVARATGNRSAGGALFTAAGVYSARRWRRDAGPLPAAALTAVYVAAMGGSHPLAKRIGAWPSVAVVTAATVLAAEAAGRRRVTAG